MKKFKKGIALVLAGIMTLSPISAFAASENKLSRGSTSVLGKSLFLEDGSGIVTHNLKSDNKDTDEIEYLVNGTDVNISITSGSLNANDTFKVNLDNAYWFFRHSSGNGIGFLNGDSARLKLFAKYIINNATVDVTSVDGSNIITGVNIDSIKLPNDLAITSDLFNKLLSTSNIKAVLPNDQAKVDSLYSNTFIFNQDNRTGAVNGTVALRDIYKFGTNLLGDKIADKYSVDRAVGAIPVYDNRFSNTNMLDAITSISGFKYKGSTNEAMTYNPSNGIYYPEINTYVHFNSSGEIDYRLYVSSDDSEATITVNKNNTGYLNIPIVSLSKSEGDVRVDIEGSGTAVSSTTLRYSVAKEAKTSLSVLKEDFVSAKYSFPINKLFISEVTSGSIQDGVIYLTAPYGFSFVDPKLKLSNGKYPRVLAEPDLRFTKISNSTAYENNPSDPVIDYLRTNANDVIRVDLRKLGISKSTKTNGKIVLEGLSLTASDFAPYGKVSITVDSGPSGAGEDAGVSKGSVEVGERIDWGVTLKTIETVPTIISGRYETLDSGTKFDYDHRAAKLSFSEKVVASWWALRESEFKLTDGVKFRKVEILNEKNFDYTGKSVTTFNNRYYPKLDPQGYVSLDAHTLKIKDLAIQRDKTASFDMYVWVSVEPGFSGDVQIIPGGNDLLTAVAPVTIAKVLAPVSIEATVTDVKIGYQWQKVADFSVLETAAGALERGKEMHLFIDDGITSYDRIALAQEFVPQLDKDSNMSITSPTTKNGGISFIIDRASYNKPATIKFSNVYVKIDRTVPESNNRPYKLVAGGNAIAANYYENAKITNLSAIDPVFTTKGIGKDFINVVSPAEGGNDAVSATVVKVTIGSKIVKVGRNGEKEITMDTDAYVSPASNSTMVPVRFVSQAFGIPDGQVVWDNVKRTVTIYNGARIIQFKIGSSDLTINGVTSTMFSPDVPPIPVVAEIKDGRSFLPFRALGNALGVTVDWDATTRTAIFNPELAATASTPSSTTITAPTN